MLTVEFFDSIPLPEPAEPVPQPEWAAPRDTEMPVSLGIDITLAVSEAAAVYVSRPAAYVNGLTFELVTVQRNTDLSDPQAIHRYGFFHGAPPRGPDLPPDFLRFGIELPGGSRLTNLGSFLPQDLAPDQPVAALLPRGGGGNPGRYSQEWWLWPLPTSGDVELVCEWPAFDIPESRAKLSGTAIRQAAARAKMLWPTD